MWNLQCSVWLRAGRVGITRSARFALGGSAFKCPDNVIACPASCQLAWRPRLLRTFLLAFLPDGTRSRLEVLIRNRPKRGTCASEAPHCRRAQADCEESRKGVCES